MSRVFGLALCSVLMLTSVARAQTGLPPEARARILVIDIDKALARKDEAGALAKLKELDNASVARPNSLFITEAKLAARTKDYPRARTALDRYFKAANATDANYNEAAEMYSALGDLEAKAKASAEAAEIAAWQAAQANNSCTGYANYLKSLSAPNAFALKAVEQVDALGCPELTSAHLSPQIYALIYAKPLKDGIQISAYENVRFWRVSTRKSLGANTWSVELFDPSRNRADLVASCSSGGGLDLANGLSVYDMRFSASATSAYHAGRAPGVFSIGEAEASLKSGWIKSWGDRPTVGGTVIGIGRSHVTVAPERNAFIRAGDEVQIIDATGTRLLSRLIATCFI